MKIPAILNFDNSGEVTLLVDKQVMNKFNVHNCYLPEVLDDLKRLYTFTFQGDFLEFWTLYKDLM